MAIYLYLCSHEKSKETHACRMGASEWHTTDLATQGYGLGSYPA